MSKKIKFVDTHHFNENIEEKLCDECELFIAHLVNNVFKLDDIKQITIYITTLNDLTKLNKTNHKKAQAICMDTNIYIVPLSNSNFSSYLSLVKHEIVHAIINQINKNVKTWVSEGLAVYFSDNSFKQIKNVMSILNNKISINDMETNFKNSKEEYFYSSIYILYLYDNYYELFLKLINGKVSIYEFENEAIKYFIDKKLFKCYNKFGY